MNNKKRLHSPLLYLLPIVALAVAGCVAGTAHERPAADAPALRVLDPVSGLSYSIPCGSCPDARQPALAENTPAMARPAPTTPVPASALAAVSAAPETTAAPVAVAALDAPVSILPPATARRAALTVEQPAETVPPAKKDEPVAGPASEETAPSAPQPALKLDTEFASAVRIVPFALGRSSAGPIGRKAIAELVPLAKQAEKIYIRGRTDASGDQASNRALATARAGTVRSAFLAAGVEQQKMHTTYCTTCYVASNDTAQGRRINRRVDVELLMPRDLIANLPKPVYAPEPPPEQPLMLSMAEPKWLSAASE